MGVDAKPYREQSATLTQGRGTSYWNGYRINGSLCHHNSSTCPATNPYNTQMQPRRLDYLAVKHLTAGEGKVRTEQRHTQRWQHLGPKAVATPRPDQASRHQGVRWRRSPRPSPHKKRKPTSSVRAPNSSKHGTPPSEPPRGPSPARRGRQSHGSANKNKEHGTRNKQSKHHSSIGRP